VGKVTLKSNSNEMLSDEFLFKSNGNEALNNVFSIKVTAMKRLMLRKNCGDEAMKHLTLHCLASSLHCFIASNAI
jgi:hypothetical protein